MAAIQVVADSGESGPVGAVTCAAALKGGGTCEGTDSALSVPGSEDPFP